jgi:hypothetical protein
MTPEGAAGEQLGGGVHQEPDNEPQATEVTEGA